MARKHYNLPPLTALATFEAAARNASFKQAAAELNVTPGAVSHQIKALEQELGRPLFERTLHGTHLTEEGRELQQVLARGFRQTAAVLDRLRRKEAPLSVTIGSTTAVATLWLMPRVMGCWRSHPDLRVNQHASDQEKSPGQPPMDLRVRYGGGSWPEEESALLFHDEILPLASPDFAERHADASLETLAGLPLIHHKSEHDDWTTWGEWFRACGYRDRIDRSLVVNNYMIALQAAQDGSGVCLGWRNLTRTLLKQGSLRPLGGFSIASPGSFYLTWPKDIALSAEAATLRDWLTRETGPREPLGMPGEVK